MNQADRAALETALGHSFARAAWLERAVTHSSCRAESPAAEFGGDNERLEFLGDAVLSLTVSEFLVRTFPDWTEGRLSKSKARLVSAKMLREAAQRLGLGRYLQLGRGEEKAGGREKQALLADAFEAVIAAIYLDAGLDAAARFVHRSLLEPSLREHGDSLGLPDHKSALQEWLQGRGSRPAEYRLVKEWGPDHRKRFFVEVRVNGQALASAEGGTKKEAEQASARLALDQLRREQNTVEEPE